MKRMMYRLSLPRRRILQGAAALGLASPMLNTKTAYSQSGGFNWQRFKGQEVEVLMETGPRADLMKKYQKEFLDQTGIKLGIEVIPEQQARQKVAIELNSGKPSFDVFNFAFHVQKRQFEKAGWLQDISPWLKDPQMMPAEYELGDVSKMGMGFATTSDGKVNALPILCDYFMVYYNKEIFEKKGVTFPKTLDELMVAAGKLHDPAAGIAGFVGRGVRNANVVLWTQLLSGWGQETVTGTPPRLITDSPDAIASVPGIGLRMAERILQRIAS